jgi:hypothetical protein
MTTEDKHTIIKSLFNIKYFEKILNKHIEYLIMANNDAILKINNIIEKLERKNNSHNQSTR